MTNATDTTINTNNLIVATGTHDYDGSRFVNILAKDNGRVSIHMRDSREHAGVFMDREEARAFAHAILDATA